MVVDEVTSVHLLKQLSYHLIDSVRTFKEKGVRAGLGKLGRTMARIFYQWSEYIIVAKALSERVHLPNLSSGLVIHQVTTHEEIAGMSSITDLANNMERFHRMFDNGSIGFIAFQNDQAVGCAWTSQKIDPTMIRVQVPLRPGDACVHNLFVSPTHRGQGIGQALVSQRLRFLREHGYERAVAAVLKDNIPALRVDEKMGYTQIGEMMHTRILFWDLYKYDIPDA
jgi:GNAT superfamily N-acetyltransferase